MSKDMGREDLLDWLEDAYCGDSFSDAIDREHPTTGQTPDYFSERSKRREQAYIQLVKIVERHFKHKKLFDDPLWQKLQGEEWDVKPDTPVVGK